MSDVADFLDSYRSTWEAVILAQRPLDDLTGFFRAPCFMVGLDGVTTLYDTPEAIREFNETRLTAFRAGKVAQCRFRGIDQTSQGPHVTLATANWELLRADGSIERAWRHYYTLLRSDAQLQILVSAFQTGA